MNNIISFLLIGSMLSFGSLKYNGSTTASVILAGSIIKTQDISIDKKYKRKDCPVCKGKGWYISGDGISKVECGYCELDNKNNSQPALDNKVIIHPPIVLKSDCPNDKCVNPNRKQK